MALRSPIAARSLSSSWGHMQFLASFPIAFTLAILANGLLASLIKERCAHDLSHCTVSADGVMYAALFLMVLGLATWNVHVLGRGCLVAALAFMLACAVASVSMSIDVLSEQHMELARSPFQNAAMSCCNGLVVGFLGRFSVQRHQMLACMRLCVGLHAFPRSRSRASGSEPVAGMLASRARKVPVPSAKTFYAPLLPLRPNC